MSAGARRVALCRHSAEIKDKLLESGAENWAPRCLALALKSSGLLEELLPTKIIAQWRLDFVQELLAILEAEWGVDLALFVRSELNISNADYDRLRLAFCQKYNQEKCPWVKRIWFKCRVLGKTFFLPQPLVSRYAWQPAWNDYTSASTVSLSADGL
eukprot:795062-Pleurochrysis_carterae.AAC.1